MASAKLNMLPSNGKLSSWDRLTLIISGETTQIIRLNSEQALYIHRRFRAAYGNNWTGGIKFNVGNLEYRLLPESWMPAFEALDAWYQDYMAAHSSNMIEN